MLATASVVEITVWVIAATIILVGALGVVLLRNPVHNALSLVATLFGVAVMFVSQEAYFLAAIQVIVYAGAIVVLFLFVIMLLGVDKFETLGQERRHTWRRPVAVVSAVALAAPVLVAVLVGTADVTGAKSSTESLGQGNDIQRIGRVLFTDYVWAFIITAVLLTIAVVGAVLLSRKPDGDPIDLDEFPIDDDDEDDDDEYVDELDIDGIDAPDDDEAEAPGANDEAEVVS